MDRCDGEGIHLSGLANHHTNINEQPRQYDFGSSTRLTSGIVAG